MRQAVVAGEAFAGSSRVFRLDPFALPVRHGDGSGSSGFVLERERALVRRAMRGGGAAMLAVPVSAYAGVSVRIVPTGEGEIRAIVELMHRDPGLTLTLVVAEAPEDAAADWLAWGKTLNLPLLVIEPDGTVKPALDRIGALVVAKPGSRRNRGLFQGRRSRFARRRRSGSGGTPERLTGREIIARE